MSSNSKKEVKEEEEKLPSDPSLLQLKEGEEIKNNSNGKIKKPFVCRFFMKGDCNKNEKCEFIHENQGISYKNHFQQFNCKHFSLGLCKSDCKFKHEILPEEKCPVELPIWYIEYILNKKMERIYEEAELFFLKEETKSLRLTHLHNETPVFSRKVMNLKPSFKQDCIISSFDKYIVEYYIVSQCSFLHMKGKLINVVLISNENLIKVKSILRKIDENRNDKEKKIYLLLFDNQKQYFIGLNEVLSYKIHHYKEISNDNDYKEIRNIVKQKEFHMYEHFLYTKVIWEWRTITQKLNYLRNSLYSNECLYTNPDFTLVDPFIGENIFRYMLKKLEKYTIINLFEEYLDEKKYEEEYESLPLLNFSNDFFSNNLHSSSTDATCYEKDNRINDYYESNNKYYSHNDKYKYKDKERDMDNYRDKYRDIDRDRRDIKQDFYIENNSFKGKDRDKYKKHENYEKIEYKYKEKDYKNKRKSRSRSFEREFNRNGYSKNSNYNKESKFNYRASNKKEYNR